jgi:hypothetical protein
MGDEKDMPWSYYVKLLLFLIIVGFIFHPMWFFIPVFFIVLPLRFIPRKHRVTGLFILICAILALFVYSLF